jgi:2Fe-2S ferredoxin
MTVSTMVQLVVTNRDGTKATVDGRSGQSVMEAIRAAGLPDLLAICGGVCACATCHVYVEPDRMDDLTPMGEDEAELLSALTHRRSASRLACQIRIGERTPGLALEIAPEE